MAQATGDGSVEWVHAPAAQWRAPVRQRARYLEAVLEYRGLEATRFGGAFFPAVVPYTCDGEARVFYWRPVVGEPPEAWRRVCATPYGVQPARDGEISPALTGDGGQTVVVEGTVGGDSREAELASEVTHDATIERVAEEQAVLAVGGERYRVERGQRRELPLGEREVELAGGERAVASPVLTVRYPGERAFYHPAVGADYRLFPSFGVDLEDAPLALDVEPGPNVDEDAVAAALGVDLDARPFAERVLWQAFVHTAFGGDAAPTLAQFPDGLLAVWPDG